MKKFKFDYSPLIYVLLFVVLGVLAVGMVFNVISLIDAIKVQPQNLFTSISIMVVTLLLIFLVLSVLLYGRYVVKDDYLYCYLGIIRTKIDIKQIYNLTYFKKQNKLVAYYGKGYSVIVIKKDDFDEFTDALRQVNHEIYFTATVDGEDK